MKLTAKQKECLLHHLTSLESCGPIDQEELFEESPEQVEDAIGKLMWRIKEGDLSAELTELEGEVLADCVEGSTWAACLSNDTEQAQAGAQRTLEVLADKIGEKIGRKVLTP